MITASIVLYKTDVEQVTEVIHSFFKGENIQDRKLYLVDNSPTNNLQILEKLYPQQAEYIHTGKNIGYGSAHNIAMRIAIADKATYHIVLNPDLSFGEEAIPALEKFMNDNSEVGLCMPKIIGIDGSVKHVCRLLPTPADMFFRFAASKWKYMRRYTYHYEMLDFDYDNVLDVPFIHGCFMMFRLSVVETVGLFDEDIFMYFEDVDLSRRMRAQSRTCMCPAALVAHIGNQESHRNMRMMIIHLRSLIYYFNKWGWFFDSERSRINKITSR